MRGLNIKSQLVGLVRCLARKWWLNSSWRSVFLEFQRFCEWFKKKSPTLIYVTGDKRKITFFLLFYSVFSSWAGCGWTSVWKEEPLRYKSMLVIWSGGWAEHCSYLEDYLMVLLLKQSFSWLFCNIQGVNPKWPGQIPVWPVPFCWHNFSWWFWAYRRCSLILIYCERLFLKSSCFTAGWYLERLLASLGQITLCLL